MTISEILSRLDGVRKNGHGYSARCPAHDDRKPSLSVSEGDDGRVLLKCFAGCDVDAICSAMGVNVRDLFARPMGFAEAAYAQSEREYQQKKAIGIRKLEARHSRPYRLYSVAELDALPEPEWLIDGALPTVGIVGLLGAKGTLKTFVTLYLVLCIALGRTVHGKKAKRNSILYVYAEGPHGAKMRLNAACRFIEYQDAEKIDRTSLPIAFLPRRIAVNDPAEMALLIDEIERRENQPKVIVIDTLNANLDGDEDGKGMNAFMAGCYEMRDKFSACVIVVHHTPLSDDTRGRGHSAFDGALDTRLMVNRDADRVTLECTHQRNGADGWRWDFETVPIAGSLALKEVSPNSGMLNGNRRLVLQEAHEGSPRTYTALLHATGLKTATLKRALNWLKANEYLRVKNRQYHVTDAGTQALGLTRPSEGSDEH
ncbi:MAG TPA: AAA family ATPase [Gemmatimonadaceae bacterium]|nr:AAA family ATPase [Gemmatimonadaceae bacterium]